MSWIQRVLYGVDLDEEQHRSDTLNAAIAAENEADRAKYGDDWYRQTVAHQEAMRVNVEEEVDQAFDEGLHEGAENVTYWVSKPFEVAGTAAGSVLRGLPWWLYGAALIAVAFFFWPVIGPVLGARLKKS